MIFTNKFTTRNVWSRIINVTLSLWGEYERGITVAECCVWNAVTESLLKIRSSKKRDAAAISCSFCYLYGFCVHLLNEVEAMRNDVITFFFRQNSMRYVSFDQWIVEAFTMSAWFKCSCAPNFSVKLVHARSACQQLMLKLSFAISARLSAQKWGPCLCRGRFLIEIDFVSSEGSCCNR